MIAAKVPPSSEAPVYWTKLTELPRPTSEEVTVRVRGVEIEKKVRFWVLTAKELSHARVNASRDTQKLLGEDAKVGNLAYEEEYQQQVAYQLLSLAARQADATGFPFFPRPVDVRDQLTDDEIAVLMVAYATFRRESGPILDEITPDEMEAWIKLLMEGGSRFPLARWSGPALTDLAMCLVSKLKAASATGTSSPGSPLGGSPSPSTDDTGAVGPTTSSIADEPAPQS
jgi:hypothetical protein